MRDSLRKLPPVTVVDFIDWPSDGTGGKSQLVDGTIRPIPLGTIARGIIHTELGFLIANHLLMVGSRCRGIFWPPIVPRVRASLNLRTPAIAVTAAPDRSDRQFSVQDPILLIEILSPGNATDTWDNVWAYTTIPSVREIVVVHSTRVLAEVLPRGPDGSWPEEPEQIGRDGTLRLDSIDFACPMPNVYAQTHLA